jgi:hypothetical protein
MFNMQVHYHHTFLRCTANKKYRQLDLPVFCSTVFWGGSVQASTSLLIPMWCNFAQSAGSEKARKQIGNKYLGIWCLFNSGARVNSRFFAIVRIYLFHKVFLHPRSLPNFKVGFRNHLISLTVWKVKV